MKIENYVNYGFVVYESKVTGKDAYKLGDVVINEDNEIGVVIQVHSPDEFRTDMFGNSSSGEVRLATDAEIEMYRPLVLNDGKFDHASPEYFAVRGKSVKGLPETTIWNAKSGNKIAIFPSYDKQPRFKSKSVLVTGYNNRIPISQWYKA